MALSWKKAAKLYKARAEAADQRAAEHAQQVSALVLMVAQAEQGTPRPTMPGTIYERAGKAYAKFQGTYEPQDRAHGYTLDEEAEDVTEETPTQLEQLTLI